MWGGREGKNGGRRRCGFEEVGGETFWDPRVFWVRGRGVRGGEMRAAMFLAALAELERRGRLSYFDGLGWLWGNVLRATPYSVKKSLQCRRVIARLFFTSLAHPVARAELGRWD